MLKLYSERRARAILQRWTPWMRELERRLGLPEPCLRAVLLREMTLMDILDPVADSLVLLYRLRWNLRRLLRLPPPAERGPALLRKRDSSVGYAQIFGAVGIRAINFALDRGLTTAEALSLPAGRRLDPACEEDLRLVWNRSRRSRAFNMELCALNLLCAAEEMTGRVDFPSCSPEELKLIFTRYNADTRRITPYGEAVYGYYTAFMARRTE